jgi:hypothetical protein
MLGYPRTSQQLPVVTPALLLLLLLQLLLPTALLLLLLLQEIVLLIRKRVPVIMQSIAFGREILILDLVEIVVAPLLPTVPHLLLQAAALLALV